MRVARCAGRVRGRPARVWQPEPEDHARASGPGRRADRDSTLGWALVSTAAILDVVGNGVRRLQAWVAVAAGPWLVHCAGRAAEGGAEAARTRSVKPTSSAIAPNSVAAARPVDASTTTADPRLSADAGGSADAAAATERPIGEGECLNFREVHHHVDVETVGAEAVHFTVTRDYEIRFPSMSFCMTEYFPLGDVLDSFALQTDGIWRQATLGPDRGLSHVVYRQDGPQERPWASMEWAHGAARLLIPPFQPSRSVQVRYGMWSHGELGHGARRWVYCSDRNSSSNFIPVPEPEVSVSDHDHDLVIARDAESPRCVDIERAAPAPKSLSARYGTYRLDGGLWWWTLELTAPESPKAPDASLDGPVVFVLDASRSMKSRAGLAPQIGVVRAYVHDAPGVGVELVLVSRKAERVFGRFVAASELDAVVATLLQASLKNGSFLDRGVELAADILREAGRPGRIVMMTDGQLRSRFDRRATAAALKRAPEGTIVHLIHPDVSHGGLAPSLTHELPEGLEELSALSGGGSYEVMLDSRDPANLHPSRYGESLDSLVARLVRPSGIESLRAAGDGHNDWPPDERELYEEPFRSGEVEFGDATTWGGFSSRWPPQHLSITGWIWGRKVQVEAQRDPALERILPRVATATARRIIPCKDPKPHRRRALAEGFLAPGLAFWVLGSGDGSNVVSFGSTDEPDCEVSEVGYGRGHLGPPPREDFAPLVREPLAPCGVAPSEKGTIRVKVEAQASEILDVSVEGAPDEGRRCIEEAIWSMTPPDDFDRWRQQYLRTEYSLMLAPTSTH
jgi:hypothetical protein